VNDGEISLFAFAINDDRPQDGEGNTGRANGLFAGKFGSSIRVGGCRKILFGQVMIRESTRLGGDRRNEYQVFRPVAGDGPRQRRRRTVVDAIVKGVVGVFVRDARKMNHGVALLQKRKPVEHLREIRHRNRGDVRILEGGRRPRRGNHGVASRGKKGNQVPSNEPVGACNEHPGFFPVVSLACAGMLQRVGRAVSRHCW
jgi:hypothetical protein